MMRKYSNTIFWIDEVHNVSVDTCIDFINLEDLKKEKERTYSIIKMLFSMVMNSKIILSSATPMINSPFELLSLLNLVLPKTHIDQKKTSDLESDSMAHKIFRELFET